MAKLRGCPTPSAPNLTKAFPISHTQPRLCSRQPTIIGQTRLKSALIGVNQGTEYCFMSLLFQPAIVQVLARIMCASGKNGGVLSHDLDLGANQLLVGSPSPRRPRTARRC